MSPTNERSRNNANYLNFKFQSINYHVFTYVEDPKSKHHSGIVIVVVYTVVILILILHPLLSDSPAEERVADDDDQSVEQNY